MSDKQWVFDNHEEAADLIERQQKRIAELEAKTSCCMGVGNGNGRLFVYGDHESIKTAQRYALERDELAATVERLREALDELQDNSTGVDGLHMNGDIATWDSLRQGGHFESWLMAFDETPRQNLNAIKRDAWIKGYQSTGGLYHGENTEYMSIVRLANQRYPDKE